MERYNRDPAQFTGYDQQPQASTLAKDSIETQLQNLEKRVESLYMGSEDLVKRLAPILRQTPEAPPSKTESARDPSSSSIRDRIQTITARVCALDYKLCFLRESVDL